MRCRLPRLMYLIAGALAVSLASCGGGSSQLPPVAVTAPEPPAPLMVGPYSATLTEYPLPAGQLKAYDIAVGPDGAVWSVSDSSVLRILGTGQITAFAEPSLAYNYGGIVSTSSALWFTANQPTNEASTPGAYAVLGRMTTSGSITAFVKMPVEDLGFSYHQINVANDGNIWIGDNGFRFPRLLAVSPQYLDLIKDSSDAFGDGDRDMQAVTPGPDGNIYVATWNPNPGFLDSYPQSAVFKMSLDDTVLAVYALPDGSNPSSIVSGSDGALWITERSSGSIARMTTSGTVTQYRLPGAKSLPQRITAGSDGALWFTDPGTNSVGRITTAGAISEYPIATPNAFPFGIVSCPTKCEGAHGRLWFTELAGGKVGKLQF